MADPGVRFPKTVALLESMGIEASTVVVDGIQRDHYQTFVLDGDGKRVVDPSTGNLATQENEWPEYVGEKVLNSLVEDIFDSRIGMAVGEKHSIDRVVLLRRTWDMDPTEANAEAWIIAKNALSPAEAAAYEDLYSRVSETTTIKSESE